MVRLFWLSVLLWGGALFPLPAQENQGSFVPTPAHETYFQMGAFRTEANAQSLVRALLRQGYTPKLRREGTLYRVYLVSAENDAPLLVERLKKDGRITFVQLSVESAGSELRLSTE